MKVILYIRKGRAGHCTMHTRLDEEPSCDNPRVLNIGRDIRDQLDRMIAACNCARPRTKGPAK